MPSPFPGMDPYLEARWLWPDVHGRLIPAIADALVPQVGPAYYVAIEETTYVVRREQPEALMRPDAAIYTGATDAPPHRGGVATVVGVTPQTVALPWEEEKREAYLEIRAAGTHEVLTVIELLSPTNKIGGGRQEYEKKRGQILRSWTSLVEIDLLRAGLPMEMTPQPESAYHIVVAKPWERPLGRVWAFGLRQLLPDIPTPLREGEQEAVIPLGKLLAERYDAARYDYRIDYGEPPPEPPLSPEDTEWVARVLEQGARAAGEPAQRTTAVPPEADDTQGQEE